MLFQNLPIRKKLLRIILLINGIVLFITCVTFFFYEYYSFRKATAEKLRTIGKIISANSTAALAFDATDDATETLAALRTEPHIVAACLYDSTGKAFAHYLASDHTDSLPRQPFRDGYYFTKLYLHGFQPVMLEEKRLGTLYLQYNMSAMYERLGSYALIIAVVMLLSFILAYILVRFLKKSISVPILSLADTANIIYNRKDYTVRAVKFGNDEMGTLTDAFNQMLEQIHHQDVRLREFNQQLEQKVKERTAQLELVNKELESFSYTVSHDLRAPLRAIVGFTSILEEDYASQLDDEARRITDVIKGNTHKMARLIDDLLAFSRLGRQEITKAPVNMAAVVKETIQTLASQTDTSRVQWIVHPLPVVPANENMIQQAWVNLISNAVKYSANHETPEIEIGSFGRNGQAVFFVKDNGVGFDSQYKDKLFKVFQRLHRSDEFEGTGIGLALVEKIVVRQGGSVWAESEINKGACFYFSLPY
jgi:Bacteriophytochrome (light-regulated signal transduction histidine kinase)